MVDETTPRDIAVFIDGTWNERRTGDPTNVLKLYEATKSGVVGDRFQVKFYIPGVGRKPRNQSQGAHDEEYRALLDLQLERKVPWVEALARSAIGGATGAGTTSRIKDAYKFICSEYDHKRDDRVFVFGFSRGALAARSLSGFMDRVGLLLRGRLKHVDEAWKLYENGQDSSHDGLKDYLHKLTGRKGPGDEPIRVHFLGVWDTVASLGLPSRLEWLTAPFTEYHQDEVPPNVMHARHGLALHELRSPFEPLLWKSSARSSLEQVWFPGAHSDVGGGYPAGETCLSDNALLWMAGEAEDNGLALDRNSTWLRPKPCSFDVHLAAKGAFTEMMPRPRRCLEGELIELPDTFFFHSSVRERLLGESPPTYDFPLWSVNAALRRVDDLTASRMVLSLIHTNRIVETKGFRA